MTIDLIRSFPVAYLATAIRTIAAAAVVAG
jgi:hypothetical protein